MKALWIEAGDGEPKIEEDSDRSESGCNRNVASQSSGVKFRDK